LLRKKTAKAPKTRQQWRPLVTKGGVFVFEQEKKHAGLVAFIFCKTTIFLIFSYFVLCFLIFFFCACFFEENTLRLLHLAKFYILLLQPF